MLPSHCYLGKAFKHNTIYWFSFSRDHQNNNDSLLLLFDGLWIVKADYMM